MYILVAAKAFIAWYLGMKLPTQIVYNKYKKDGIVRNWPFWVFFFLLWIADCVLDIFLGYIVLGLTTEDFHLGTGNTLNIFVQLLYYVFPIVGSFRRKKVCSTPAAPQEE